MDQQTSDIKSANVIDWDEFERRFKEAVNKIRSGIKPDKQDEVVERVLNYFEIIREKVVIRARLEGREETREDWEKEISSVCMENIFPEGFKKYLIREEDIEGI